MGLSLKQPIILIPRRDLSLWQKQEAYRSSGKNGQHANKESGLEAKGVEPEHNLKKNHGEEDEWPPSLRRYLKRAFETCTKKHGWRLQEELERALHRIVTDAMAENRMQTTDWDSEPLPR